MALLLSRTHYSLLTAPSSPQALCEEAVRLGLSHLVLNDTNGLYGLYPFAQAARRVGIQAVFGAEVVDRGRRLSLIARDASGYASLCALLSRSHGVGSAADGRASAGGAAGSFDLPRACERFADGLWFVCGDPRLLPELSVRVPRERLLVALPPRGVTHDDLVAGRQRPGDGDPISVKLTDLHENGLHPALVDPEHPWLTSAGIEYGGQRNRQSCLGLDRKHQFDGKPWP